jgi:hypothetical protein
MLSQRVDLGFVVGLLVRDILRQLLDPRVECRDLLCVGGVLLGELLDLFGLPLFSGI